MVVVVRAGDLAEEDWEKDVEGRVGCVPTGGDVVGTASLARAVLVLEGEVTGAMG